MSYCHLKKQTGELGKFSGKKHAINRSFTALPGRTIQKMRTETHTHAGHGAHAYLGHGEGLGSHRAHSFRERADILTSISYAVNRKWRFFCIFPGKYSGPQAVGRTAQQTASRQAENRLLNILFSGLRAGYSTTSLPPEGRSYSPGVRVQSFPAIAMILQRSLASS